MDASPASLGDGSRAKVVSFESLPAMVKVPALVAAAAASAAQCSRCRSRIAEDWKFCGTCGQKRAAGRGKGSAKGLALKNAPSVVKPGKIRQQQQPAEPADPTDLASLPTPLVQSLNTVLKGFKCGIFNEQRAEIDHKALLVAALEIESAMQMEDAYVKLATEGKVAKISGPVMQEPAVHEQGYGKVYGSSIYKSSSSSSSIGKSSMLPSIHPSTHAKTGSVLPGKKPKGRGAKPGALSKQPGCGYLDEVGSVAAYYTEFMEREKELAGLSRVIAEDPVHEEHVRQRRHRDFLRLQQELLGEEDEEDGEEGRGRGFLVNGHRHVSSAPLSHNADRAGFLLEEASLGTVEEGKGSPVEVIYWGALRERGRFFLPRGGHDAGRQVDAQVDIIEAFRANQRRSQAGDEKDGEDEEEEGQERPMTPLNWQQVLLEADQLQAIETPMIWTKLIRPFTPPLSRPLTPEPTSDDEDDLFEKKLQQMEDDKRAEKERAAEAVRAQELAAETDAASLACPADGFSLVSELGSEATPRVQAGLFNASLPSSKPASPAAGAGKLGDAPGGLPSGDADDETIDTEKDHVDPLGASKQAAQARAEKKARIAKARRALAFELAFKQAQELGRPKPKRYKPRKKKPSEMDEEELREYELQKALASQDSIEEANESDDDDEDSTLTPEPIKIRTALPQFKAHSVISRMYKTSCRVLKEAVLQAQFRLVDEYLPPPRSGRPMPFQRFGRMLACVDEALLQAAGIDMQAKTEFAAFQMYLTKARAEPATKVAVALESITAYHAQFNDRYKALHRESQADPRSVGKLNKLRETAEADLFSRGRKLQALQADEAAITQDLRALEFVTIETVRAWRPRHAELIGQAQWAQKALQAVLFTSAAKVIQRTVRRKLLFLFWGEPEHPWVDPTINKMKQRTTMLNKYHEELINNISSPKR